MHLICPSCETKFLVNPRDLGATGRTVRCGRCAHSWFQVRPEEPDAAPAAETPAQTETPAPAPAPAAAGPERRARDIRRARPRLSEPAPRRARTRRPAVVAGWALLVIVAAGLAAGAYVGRAQIMAAVPATADLYRLVGLAPARAGAGLELREVKSMRRVVDGAPVVVIEGLVANVTAHVQAVPRLRASLTDGAGVLIEEWTFTAEDASLPPGGVTGFATSTRKAPREGNLAIQFIRAE